MFAFWRFFLRGDRSSVSGRKFWRAFDVYVRVVLDEEGNQVPQGQEGELAATGPMVFTGYYKAEEANRKSFTKDGYFRSGDLARINSKGNFTITGRTKDLINRGGEKVSAEEVEEMLITMDGVASIAAVAMPVTSMSMVLVSGVPVTSIWTRSPGSLGT